MALAGASDKSAFSMIAYQNLVRSGFGAHTYLVNRRGVPTHGQPAVTSCTQIGAPVEVAYLMVPGTAGTGRTYPLRVDGTAIEALDAVVTWTDKEDI